MPSSVNSTVTGTATVQNKYCHACGGQLDVRAEICPKCGVRQAQPVSRSKRSRVAAVLFALLLGGLGVHKFYLGNVGLGIVYLLFCWTFIPAIIGFIEGLVILAMSDATFYEKYHA